MPETTDRGGRPRSLEAILRDASMANRMVLEQLQGAAATFQDHGQQLAAINAERVAAQKQIDAAIAELGRDRVGWDGFTERRRAHLQVAPSLPTSAAA